MKTLAEIDMKLEVTVIGVTDVERAKEFYSRLGWRQDVTPPWVVQFNAVLDRAEQAYAQLESFNADVAHELQTPLANLIGAVEVELARPRAPEELEEALLSALEEARRMSQIVVDMLFLTRADRGAVARRSAPLSLADQAGIVVEFHEAMLESAGLRVQVCGDALLSVDVSLVRRAISNLLGNAEIDVQKGFAGVMETFDNTRPLVAGMAVGVARAALERTRELLVKALHPSCRLTFGFRRAAHLPRRLQAAVGWQGTRDAYAHWKTEFARN